MKRNIQAGKRQTGGIDFEMLNAGDLDRIHASTLEVLWKTGIFVEDQEALEIYDGGGALVDKDSKTVKIPPHVLEDAISSAPEIAVLASRDGENDLVLEKNRIHYDNFGEAVKMVDPETRELRATTKHDLEVVTRIVDSLEHLDICHQSMGPSEVTPETAAIHIAEAMLSNTTKHCLMGPQSGYMARQIIKMLKAIAEDEEDFQRGPLATFTTSTVTPLKMPQDCCELVITCAREGMPVVVLAQAMAGGTSPVTLAGTLVLHNAEVLSGLLLSQLVRKGTPFIYSSSSGSLDLRFGTSLVGNAESAMLNAAVAEMARYYKVPCRVGGG